MDYVMKNAGIFSNKNHEELAVIEVQIRIVLVAELLLKRKHSKLINITRSLNFLNRPKCYIFNVWQCFHVLVTLQSQ